MGLGSYLKGSGAINPRIANLRLHNQYISRPILETPESVVGWLVAVQSQDYAAAKWAIGQRAAGINDAAVEQSFTDGTILRTHVMRPTWHFVLPADIRWLLELTSPRVDAILSTYDRKMGLERAEIKRTSKLMARALEGSNFLTRTELAAMLEREGIATRDGEQRLMHIVMHAELDGVICSGPRRGKQFTYALLDERAPQVKALTRDEALVALSKRFFTSRGPVTVNDFSWWSGLTVGDCRKGLEAVKDKLEQETIDGQIYWFAPVGEVTQTVSPTVYLLPNYDEMISAYKDRSAMFDAQYASKLDARGNVVFNHFILLDGQLVGTWKRTINKRDVVVEIEPFLPLNAAQTNAVAQEAQRFGEFVALPVVMA